MKLAPGKLFLVTFFFAFTIHISKAQEEWRIDKTLQTDSFCFASLIYSYTQTEEGFGVINDKGKVEWQIPVPGYIFGMGKFKGNIILFYTEEHNHTRGYEEIKAIHAAIVSLKQKRIISDKIVFNNKKRSLATPYILNDPSGNFNTLLIRNSAFTGTFLVREGFATDIKTAVTETLTRIDVSDELAPVEKQLESAAIGGSFAGICPGQGKDFYIISVSNNQAIAEKFTGQEKPSQKLSTNISYKDKSYVSAVAGFDSYSGDAVDVSLKYENMEKDKPVGLFRFDFSAGKALASDNIFDKSKLLDHKKIDDLYPVKVLETKDNIILIKEIEFTGHERQDMEYIKEDGIVDIYSKDMHLVKEEILAKGYEARIYTLTGISGHVKDGKLYVVTMEQYERVRYKDFLYTFDIPGGLKNKKILERSDARIEVMLDTDNAIWFPESFVIPRVSFRSHSFIKYNTELQTVSYK
jgi:hypothetical protein